MNQLTLQEALSLGQQGIEQVSRNAGSEFLDRATDFILDYLRKHGAASGEDLTDQCKAEGIVPHDDRAFGHVFMRLLKKQLIYRVGTVPRRKGHGTSGATVWAAS